MPVTGRESALSHQRRLMHRQSRRPQHSFTGSGGVQAVVCTHATDSRDPSSACGQQLPRHVMFGFGI